MIPALIPPPDARIQKRPILHPAIPSPYTGANQPKVIYVSTTTPFVSVVKRVRNLLALVEKRSMGNVDLVNSKSSDKQRLKAVTRKEKEPEEVLLKATNKAIEKVLGLALYFQGQQDCRVRLRTASVGVVDDIVEVKKPKLRKKVDVEVGGNDHELDIGGGEDGEELPETQIRKLSVVEVGISLR
ncbi:MAG: hypothetical protein Q9187_007786 [Circinaria calcarea]